MEPGASGGRHTWQTVTTDVGASFAPLVDISEHVDGGIHSALWQRARRCQRRRSHGNWPV
jgi:hypothetical protein